MLTSVSIAAVAGYTATLVLAPASGRILGCGNRNRCQQASKWQHKRAKCHGSEATMHAAINTMSWLGVQCRFGVLSALLLRPEMADRTNPDTAPVAKNDPTSGSEDYTFLVA